MSLLLLINLKCWGKQNTQWLECMRKVQVDISGSLFEVSGKHRELLKYITTKALLKYPLTEAKICYALLNLIF